LWIIFLLARRICYQRGFEVNFLNKPFIHNLKYLNTRNHFSKDV
jgi:hypothetical protein